MNDTGNRHRIFIVRKMVAKSKSYLSTPGSRTTVFIKYYPEREILEIGFKSNEVYQYLEVTSSVWDDYRETVLSGNSSGVFFNRRIKDKYEFRKIT